MGSALHTSQRHSLRQEESLSLLHRALSPKEKPIRKPRRARAADPLSLSLSREGEKALFVIVVCGGVLETRRPAENTELEKKQARVLGGLLADAADS